MDSFLGTKKKSRSLMTLGGKVEIYRTLKGKHILLTLQLEATPILGTFIWNRAFLHIYHPSCFSLFRKESISLM